MLRTQGLSYGKEKSLKHSKWEALTVYILDELLCKQRGDGLELSEAGNQLRQGANETVQEPNEEKTGKEGKFFKHNRCYWNTQWQIWYGSEREERIRGNF